jgi:2-oxoglutarate ferredoxin oxidoreductase subunit alpha
MNFAGERFVQGNEACTLGAIAAGARFYAGYPISPATEITELCSVLMPQYGGIYVQMEDEIASLAAVIGASLGGMKAFTATSGPGFSLMQENIGLALMAEIPCVIVNVQRFGVSTGVATKPGQGDVMQARWGTHGEHSNIVISAATVQECFDMTVVAFNLAERFRTPVILLKEAVTAHLREKIVIPTPEEIKLVNRLEPAGDTAEYLPFKPVANDIPAMATMGSKYIMSGTGLMHDEAGYASSEPVVGATLTERLARKIENYQEELPEPLYYGDPMPQVVIVSYGVTARAAREALKRIKNKELRAGVVQLRTIWPFPAARLQQLCQGAPGVIVAEMNRGQLVREVERVLPDHQVRFVGQADGEVVMPNQIAAAVEEVASCRII